MKPFQLRYGCNEWSSTVLIRVGSRTKCKTGRYESRYFFLKNRAAAIAQLEKTCYLCTCKSESIFWRDGRVVDCGGLENRWGSHLRGFESLSLRWTYWTEMVSKRTKSYKSMICGFFYCPKVRLPRLQKYGKRQSFVTKSLPIPCRTKTVTICPQMTW